MQKAEAPVRRPAPRRWRELRWSTRLSLLATVFLLLTFSLEFGSRVYWTAIKGIPFFRTGRIWETFFPEVQDMRLAEAPKSHDDDTFDVLILGPSVWHFTYGAALAPRLEEDLKARLGRPVRLYNASFPSRTSRDALVLYRHLDERRFDLVLVYHGINDAFLNNCPADRYRDDYAHALRYRQLRLLQHHPEQAWLSFPVTIGVHVNRLLDVCRIRPRPGEKYYALGTDTKTVPAFRANLEKLLALARQRGDHVLLTTFAHYIPADYTREAFEAKKLDYGRHINPAEMWGSPEMIRKSLSEHNAVVRELAAHAPDVQLVDLARLMPEGRTYYDDPCHLTKTGCETMADLVACHLDYQRLTACAKRGPSPSNQGDGPLFAQRP